MKLPFFLKEYGIVEYYEEYRLIHVSARNNIDIRTEDDINQLHRFIVEHIEKFNDSEKLFLIIDYGSFIIDPSLVPELARLTSELYQYHLYENGGCAYGHSVSRIAAKISGTLNFVSGRHLFKTRKEAFDYIETLAKEILPASGEEESEPIPLNDSIGITINQI